jgi:hypothetical protein
MNFRGKGKLHHDAKRQTNPKPQPPAEQVRDTQDKPPDAARPKPNTGSHAGTEPGKDTTRGNILHCDTDTLIAIKSTGKSYREMAKITGISKDVINRKIKHLLPIDATQQYINTRADILAEMQRKLLLQCDTERLKKMPAASAILAACQLYDKERIERGLSNGDQPIMVIIRDRPQPAQVEGKVIDITKSSANQGIELNTQDADIVKIGDNI